MQPSRSADILVRTNTPTSHSSENACGSPSVPPFCGQECPRSYTFSWMHSIHVLPQQAKVHTVFFERNPWGRLVVHAGNKSSRLHQRDQPLELRAHGGLAFVHGHLVEVADHAQVRIPLDRK